MNKEEIEELKDFTIDITDIDELALGLEVCSKKSNMVIQEFADTIIQLQKEIKILKENAEHNDKVVDKVNWENQLLKKEKKQLKEEYNKIQKAYESTFSDYQQLKDNWNMLKEHLTNRYNNGTESISYRQVFIEIREAMQVLEIQQELEQRRQELEQGSDSNE